MAPRNLAQRRPEERHLAECSAHILLTVVLSRLASFAECHSAECYSVECHSSVCHFAECRCAGRRSAECSGASVVFEAADGESEVDDY